MGKYQVPPFSCDGFHTHTCNGCNCSVDKKVSGKIGDTLVNIHSRSLDEPLPSALRYCGIAIPTMYFSKCLTKHKHSSNVQFMCLVFGISNVMVHGTCAYTMSPYSDSL